MRGQLRSLRHFLADEGANVATMTALLMPVGIALAAVAVDGASLFFERRQAQGLADLAAITAAANIGKPHLAAETVFRDNGFGNISVVTGNTAPEMEAGAGANAVRLSVQRGRYVSDPLLAVNLRFTPNAEPYNAVKVSMRKTGTQFFSSAIMGPPSITTSAIASAAPEAAFSVGSRLLRIDGGLLNAILGGLLGTSLSLNVMDYEALIKADVDAFAFFDALATELDLTAGTYADVLESRATVGQIASAMASVGKLDRTSASALLAVARGSSGNSAAKVPLSHMFDLGEAAKLAIGQHPAGLDAGLGVMDVLSGSAAIANGKNQVRLDLAATMPGLLAVTLDLAVGEPPRFAPWFAIGEAGQLVRTAQTRLLLTAEIGGPGGLIGTSVKLPIYLELAFAEARLASVACPTGNPASLKVAISARPGVADLRIAALDATRLRDFATRPAFSSATLVQAPLLTVSGQAHIEIANTAFSTLNFDSADIRKKTIKRVSTRNLTESLTRSLIDDLTLDIKLAGLGLGLPSTLKPTLTGLLGTAAPALDGVLYNLLTALGVRIGEADIRVHGASCGLSVLVQ